MTRGYICPYCVPLTSVGMTPPPDECPWCRGVLLRTCHACTCPLCSDPDAVAEMDRFADDNPDLVPGSQDW